MKVDKNKDDFEKANKAFEKELAVKDDHEVLVELIEEHKRLTQELFDYIKKRDIQRDEVLNELLMKVGEIWEK